MLLIMVAKAHLMNATDLAEKIIHSELNLNIVSNKSGHSDCTTSYITADVCLYTTNMRSCDMLVFQRDKCF